MATMKSLGKFIPDFDASVLLRNPSNAATTATTAETGVTLDRLSAAYWDNGELPSDTYNVGVIVTAIKRTVLDETYVITVEVGDATFTTPVVVATSPVLTKTGSFILTFDADLVQNLIPTATRMRIKVTVGGTAPSIQYGAFLTDTDIT